MNLSIYFPHLNDKQLAVMSKKAVYFAKGPALNAKANEECDVLCPYDDVLKGRPNLISKVMDPNINPLERERLMASLQRLPASKRNNLSDEELVMMLPSRYNQTMTDEAAFAEHLSNVVDEYSDEDNKSDIVKSSKVDNSSDDNTSSDSDS